MSLHESNPLVTPPPNDYFSQGDPPSVDSNEDYRSIINDLTLEIQALKKELERYKRPGPAALHGDELFVVKVHGLPQEKKIELEATLRDIAINLDGSPDAPSSQKKEKIPSHNRDHVHPRPEIQRKHDSSPDLNLQRPDSAYDSTLGTPYSLSTLKPTNLSNHKAEDNLQGFPKGLSHQHVFMTDNERKSLVVGRLEELFTGNINGTDMSKKQPTRGSVAMATVVADAQMADPSTAREPPTHGAESIQEVTPLPLERNPHPQRNNFDHGQQGSASGLNGNQMEPGGNGHCLTSDAKPSSPVRPTPKQRPTRPCDLDPDRAQSPSENMNYVRHLGLLPPKLLPGQQVIEHAHQDTEGWVYLNLLCSLAQLHMINVTPDFVRSAVSGISTKLQLSRDGHKIRWRGEPKGTNSSNYNWQKSHSVETIHGSENNRLDQMANLSCTNDTHHDGSTKDMTKPSSQLKSFYYKPIFAHQDSSGDLMNETGYPSVIMDGNTFSESGWGLSRSRRSPDKLHRREGSITYYSGAPFCTDLSGDPDDMPPTSHTLMSGQTRNDPGQSTELTQSPQRTMSGSLLTYRPLTDRYQGQHQQSSAINQDKNEAQDLTNTNSEESSEVELNFIWSDDEQYIEQKPLVSSGLGGVLPDDHFMIVVDTKRPKQDVIPQTSQRQIERPNQSTEEITHPQVKISTSHLAPRGPETKLVPESPTIEMEFLSARMKMLEPVPLPPPAIFFPPSSTDPSTSTEDDGSSSALPLSCG